MTFSHVIHPIIILSHYHTHLVIYEGVGDYAPNPSDLY
jgi:hypothetical protein